MVGDKSLKLSFPRLYQIAENKLCSFAEMGDFVGSTWEWRFKWQRPLFVWENSLLQNFLQLVQNFCAWFASRRRMAMVSRGSSWHFFVKSAYSWGVLLSTPQVSSGEVVNNNSKALWSSNAPSKILVFSWLLFQDRIPHKINLVRRSLLNREQSVNCVLCEQYPENFVHIFLLFFVANIIWRKVLFWLGVSSVILSSVESWFMLFRSFFVGKVMKNRGVSIWFYVIWSLWLSRNPSFSILKRWIFLRLWT
jgi:hypothetical protein